MKNLLHLNSAQNRVNTFQQLRSFLLVNLFGLKVKAVRVPVSNTKLQRVNKSFINMKFVQVGLIALSLGTIACRKELPPAPQSEPAKVTATKDLKVSADFNWETVQRFDFEINPNSKGLVMVMDEKANIFYKAFLLPGQSHKANVTVPSYLIKAFVYFNGNKEEITLGATKSYSSNLK
jgi:hypothetical protein